MSLENNRKRKRRRKVLEEQVYLDNLTAIVRKSYFPSLDAEYKDQADGGDRDNNTLEDLSLEAFHSRFTSEDNSSFAQVLSSFNEKRRERYERVYGAVPLLSAPPEQRLLLTQSRPDDEAGTSEGQVTRPENTRFKLPIPPNGQNLGTTSIADKRVVQLTPDVRPRPSDNMFTWGEVESTPQRITKEPSAAEGIFYIPPTPKREQTASSLLSSARRHNRRKENAAKLLTSIRDSPFGGLLSTPKRPNNKPS